MATLLNEFYPKTNKGRAIYIKEIYCSKCRNQIYKAGVIWSNEENKEIAKADITISKLKTQIEALNVDAENTEKKLSSSVKKFGKFLLFFGE